jgi:hypothetical protein
MSFPLSYPKHPPLITFSTDIFHPLLTPLTTFTYTSTTTETDTISASDQERLPPGGFSLRHGFPYWFSKESPEPNVQVSVFEILDYLRYSFNEEKCLDSIPVATAANPGAYHAWQSYKTRKAQKRISVSSTPTGAKKTSVSTDSPLTNRTRRPGEWNWEGVWEERVKRGIHSSLSEQALYGNPADELIRFSNLDNESVEEIIKALESVGE